MWIGWRLGFWRYTGFAIPVTNCNWCVLSIRSGLTGDTEAAIVYSTQCMHFHQFGCVVRPGRKSLGRIKFIGSYARHSDG